MTESNQKERTYALLKEVYGPLENLSQKQWAQIERGVKALMKEHGPDIPLESLKAMKRTDNKYHAVTDAVLDFIGDPQNENIEKNRI